MNRIITLTTDFGVSSPYVAAMKGVILSIHPNAVLVDVTHAVPPQNIRHAALVLSEITPYFPSDTVHVAVVDPGVGTQREIVYARIGLQQYIAPDNGLLSHLALRVPPSTIRAVTNPAYWLPSVSHTFHGRDIMAPVAAHLTLGLEPDVLGPPRDRLVELAWPEVRVAARKIEGAVQSIDSFGNLITNITSDALANVPRDESLSVVCDEHETRGLFTTYADQPPMTFLALIGSSGNLELSIVGESAALMLGIPVGSPVVVSW
jgi:S-adenosylmethionine hydrolase